MGRAFEFRKARKMKRWSAMSKAFTRIGKDISMAVKAGGPDPTNNSRLKIAIQNAKGVNMPKDNVESAIKKALNKEDKDLNEIVYEGVGPYGVALMVETATDNQNRTVADLRVIFSRNGGTLGTSGSVAFMFERKGVFKFPAEGLNVEELEFELIDFGAEEVFEDEGEIFVHTDYKDFGQMQKALEERKINVTSSELQRIPTTYKEGLTEEQQAEVEQILEKLEENDDVQNVYHTMAG
ncbi:MAG: YebC/PmpR family DNA-binding transcriptional regulator [Bacteroidetes bacterium]|nr:MAG: YebC/PmpR family DNA-binding transcriptional regulator [Bacteroidota bacterium]